jgi:hypothetical protein
MIAPPRTTIPSRTREDAGGNPLTQRRRRADQSTGRAGFDDGRSELFVHRGDVATTLIESHPVKDGLL